MSVERQGPSALALAAAAVAVCCGLPVLAGAAAAVSFLGLGLGSWILVLAGSAVVILAVVETRRRPARPCEPEHRPRGRR